MSEPRSEVRHIELFISFLKIGLFTFGGGYAMVPLIEREVVESHNWVRKENFLDLLTIAQAVPGPIALNSAAFVGYSTRKYTGALAAVLGIVIPSFFVILTVALFFNSIRDNAVVEAAFKAMRPVVIALIISPIVSFIRGMHPIAIVVMILTIAIIALFEISPAVLILGAIIFATLWCYFIGRHEIKQDTNREEGQQ